MSAAGRFFLLVWTLAGKFKDKAENLNNVVRRKAEGDVAAKSEGNSQTYVLFAQGHFQRSQEEDEHLPNFR